jgi:hypothetical protein
VIERIEHFQTDLNVYSLSYPCVLEQAKVQLMQTGDQAAIVRTVGGKGLLQQFIGDRRLQVVLAKVPPGRYVLTVVVIDLSADKKFS